MQVTGADNTTFSTRKGQRVDACHPIAIHLGRNGQHRAEFVCRSLHGVGCDKSMSGNEATFLGLAVDTEAHVDAFHGLGYKHVAIVGKRRHRKP